MRSSHARANCKYRNFTCYSCGKAGHIAAACKGKKAQLNKVEGTSDIENAIDHSPFLCITVAQTNKHGIEIPVQLNGISIVMELDTGAGISIISEETFDKHFKNSPLKPCSTQLHTHNGDQIKVCGQFDTSLKYNSRCITLQLVVVEGSGPSLFGRDWLAKVKVDWDKIFNIGVHPLTPPHLPLHSTIQSHPDIFKSGLGTIKGIKVGAQPKCFTAVQYLMP